MLQVYLLEEAWRDLFLLSLAQWDIGLEVQTMLDCAGIKQDDIGKEKLSPMLNDIRNIRDLVNRFRQLKVDRTEFACLKAVALFRPGE